MADIELVIKLDEELYNYMQKGEYDKHLDKRFDYQIRFAVKDGTPIPKRHGNIIDVNSIKEISLSNITYHMVWQPRNDTELKCRIEAPILVKSDAKSEITVKTEGEN
jgi:hypothetical protein